MKKIIFVILLVLVFSITAYCQETQVCQCVESKLTWREEIYMSYGEVIEAYKKLRDILFMEPNDWDINFYLPTIIFAQIITIPEKIEYKDDNLYTATFQHFILLYPYYECVKYVPIK
jgi:hypothetical protein